MTIENAFGKTFIVFGATGGIGSALSKRLVQLRSQLVIAGRSKDKLDKLAVELATQSKVVDVTDYTQVEDAINETINVYGKIDGIVNCAGSLMLKPAHITKDTDWMDTINVNLTSSFNMLKAGVKQMMKTGGGSIVFIASAAAQIGLANHEAIAAAKAGIIGLTKSAASTYAGYNIRVNNVAPGLTDTPLAEKITRSPASLEYSKSMHALGRIGKIEDIVSAIVFLLDPDNDWITGQTMFIDGGLSTVRPK